jgi:hypothetical protein
VGPIRNCVSNTKIEKQLSFAFHAFLLSLITDNFQLLPNCSLSDPHQFAINSSQRSKKNPKNSLESSVVLIYQFPSCGFLPHHQNCPNHQRQTSFSSPLSIQTQPVTDPSLHCYNCRKKPRDWSRERSTSEIPGIVRSLCQFLLCFSKSNFCNGFFILQNTAATPLGFAAQKRRD